MELTSCQKNALKHLQSNNNIFLTGKAGSGKSFLLSRYKEQTGNKLYVVAATGIAAVLVEGQTFHSFFKLGCFEGTREAYLATMNKALFDDSFVSFIQNVKSVIIDEISMIPGYTLACAEEICRRARFNSKPWGGIRLIAVGDFAQLPPVSRNGPVDWAFDHPVWEHSNFTPVVLKTMVRTQDDKLLYMLNKIRAGKTTKKIRRLLDSCLIPKERVYDARLQGTRVFPRNVQVDKYNNTKFNELNTPISTYNAIFSGDRWARDRLEVSSPVPAKLRLRVGAVVLIRKNNMIEGYVNGTSGTVTSLDNSSVTVELTKGGKVIILKTTYEYLYRNSVVATMTQFPLCLGWALTGHKVQGATLDRAVVDLSSLWDSGQFYTMLSRVRSLDHIHLSGWDLASIKVAKKVQKFHESIGFVDVGD